MLYAARYQRHFASRGEELAFQRALAARLLRYALWEEHRMELSTLSLARTPAGKPYFENCPLCFSLSHTRGLVCCALSASPVGVDAEAPHPVREALVRRVCTQEELRWLAAQGDPQAAFLSLWTLKESVMKLSGQGMAYGFQRAAFTFPHGAPCFHRPEVVLSQHGLPGGFAVSAASLGEAFPRVLLVDMPG